MIRTLEELEAKDPGAKRRQGNGIDIPGSLNPQLLKAKDIYYLVLYYKEGVVFVLQSSVFFLLDIIFSFLFTWHSSYLVRSRKCERARLVRIDVKTSGGNAEPYAS